MTEQKNDSNLTSLIFFFFYIFRVGLNFELFGEV